MQYQNWMQFMEILRSKTYDIGNCFEWLKTSIEFAMDDEESKDDLICYMKEMVKKY